MSKGRQQTIDRMRSSGTTVQRSDAGRWVSARPGSAPPASAPAPEGGGTQGAFASLLQQAAHEILAVTYWFEPAARSEPYPLTIRFTGRRTDAEGPLQPSDRFVWDETIEQVIPGCGPIAVTARVPNLHPGMWAVTALVQGPERFSRAAPLSRRREHRGAALVAAATAADGQHSYPLLPRLWRRWAPATGSSLDAAEPVHTSLAPFARVPGTLPLSWTACVFFGMVLAVVLQALIMTRERLDVQRVLLATFVAIVVGIVGAKSWFIVKHRNEHRFEGWCIQGFVIGASLTALLLFTMSGLPTGAILDATAPGLFLGMAIGRVGCFFAGCCGGPPTTSRWGIWSSDQRVGARRIPTQLMESALALGLGLGTLVEVLTHGPARGAFFVAGLAAYTLGRQGILRLRAEPQQTELSGWATAAAATLVLAFSVALLVQCHLQPMA